MIVRLSLRQTKLFGKLSTLNNNVFFFLRVCVDCSSVKCYVCVCVMEEPAFLLASFLSCFYLFFIIFDSSGRDGLHHGGRSRRIGVRRDVFGRISTRRGGWAGRLRSSCCCRRFVEIVIERISSGCWTASLLFRIVLLCVQAPPECWRASPTQSTLQRQQQSPSQTFDVDRRIRPSIGTDHG